MNNFSTTYSSPLGTIVIENDGECLTGMRFVDKPDSGETIRDIPIIADTRKWLDDYFSGKQPRNIPRLNPQGTPFQKEVWAALFTIDYGKTKTYGEIAKMVGCRSAQAVGQAISRNPIAIIIPCHRVICADDSIGEYAYGIDRKKQLLQLELAKYSYFPTICKKNFKKEYF